MVEGTLHLSDGKTAVIMAEDMLTALKLANEKYWGKVRQMDFMTVDDKKIVVKWKESQKEVMPDG